jgi:hypothetical protein
MVSTKKRFFSSVNRAFQKENILSLAALVPGTAKEISKMGCVPPPAHNKWVLCQNSMASPSVADGDGLQICTVAASILNKQLQTADKGGAPAWCPHHKK